MILAILQARMSSTRLPGKVLKPVLGEPILKFQIRRIKLAKRIDRIVLATSVNLDDAPLEGLAADCGIDCYRGSLDHVLERFVQCARKYQPSHVVRLTGDCPVIDPGVIDEVIGLHLASCADFTANTLRRTFPDGLDTEIMRAETLEEVFRKAKTQPEIEHVTRYIYDHRDEFKLASHEYHQDHSRLRWTLDTPADFELLKGFIECRKGDPRFSWTELLT